MKKILLGLIGLLFAIPAVAADLPSGYTELQYIESTGTQWIDTRYFFTDIATETVTIDFMKTGTDAGTILYGTRKAYKYNGYGIQFQDGGNTYMQYGEIDSGIGSNAPGALNTRYTLIQTGPTYSFLDASYTSTGATPTQSYPLYLFTMDNGGNPSVLTPMRVYSFVIKDRNNSIKLQLVPAKNSSGVVGLYDTVSGNFLTNAGTGEFIAGPVVGIHIATTAYNSARFSPVVTELNDTIATIRDVVTNTINQTKAIADLQATKQTRPDEQCPAGKKCLLVEDNDGQPHWYEIIENAYGLPNGYTALEYIQSTGTQWIDTGITGSTNAIIDMQGTPRTDDTIVFMLAPIDATAFQNGFGQYQSTMTGSFDIATRRVYNVSYTSSSVTVNGVDVSNRYIANNVNLALFGSTASNRKIRDAKLYSAKIYNNDTLLRNFVPAQQGTTIGLYDTVSGTFFTNKGSGTFIAGPAVQ